MKMTGTLIIDRPEAWNVLDDITIGSTETTWITGNI